MSWVSEIIGERIHGKEKIYCRFTEVKEVLLKNKAKVSSFGISTGNCIDVFVSIHGSSLRVLPLGEQDLNGKDKHFGHSLGFPGRNLQLH